MGDLLFFQPDNQAEAICNVQPFFCSGNAGNRCGLISPDSKMNMGVMRDAPDLL
jgi:hypothetical protein